MKVSQDGPRRPVPVGSDGRGSFEPRLCRWGWRKPGQSAERCATAPGGIALLHLDDGINEFSTGSSGPGPPPLLGRKEAAILSVPQGLVEAQESRRFQNDGGTDQAGRPHQQSAPTGDEAVGKAEM